MQEHVDQINRALADETQEEFDQRVRQQTQFLKQQIQDGILDNTEYTIGLELEAYAIGEDGHIANLSDDVLADAPFNPELGLHNAELNTTPALFDDAGIRHQADDIAGQYTAANTYLEDHNLFLLLDAIWTLHEGDSLDFLTDIEEFEGHSFPENMRTATRYHAIDNAFVNVKGGEVPFKVPGADHGLPTMLFECLATSIQPHLQVPDTDDFPQYYNTASRTMAPVLALATNSPFLPPELYNDVDDPEQLVDDTFHELRITIFEQAVNVSDTYDEMKVRFPQDLDTAEDAVDYVAEDMIYAPALREWNNDEKEEYKDEFWEWNYKRKTFWRWIRPVFGGQPVDGACDDKSLRIEYRPLPTQPSVKDIVSLQALTVGLVHGLCSSDHPITDLDWATAKDSFYSVMENGLDADIHWVTEDGEHTTDRDVIFEEVFRYARNGLSDRDVPESVQDQHLEPLEERWEQRMTPSRWKKDMVQKALDDGASLEGAIHAMQRKYIRNAQAYDRFTDWR